MNAEGTQRDDRSAKAKAALLDLGFYGITVAVDGYEREIAVLSASPEQFEALLDGIGAEVAKRIRALGFRYVAVELAPS